MQLVLGDAYLRQRKEAARLEGMSLGDLDELVARVMARVELDPRAGARHQADDSIVTRWVPLGRTSHVLLYSVIGDNALRLLAVVEQSGLDALRTRDELVVPDRLEPYVEELRADDDYAVEQKRLHWIERRARVESGELGNDPEHRSLLRRGIALFAEAVDAEQSRRVLERLEHPSEGQLALVQSVGDPVTRRELLERIELDALRSAPPP